MKIHKDNVEEACRPYIVRVDPISIEIIAIDHLPQVTVNFHLKWLEENKIHKYHWEWIKHGDGKEHELQFRFENEDDKLLFTLRWA